MCASTARGWPGTRGHARARARARVNADGHAARPRKTRARWCGHVALPDHCQRPLAAANARASVLVGVGVEALVGREGEGTVERGRAWASSSIVVLRLAWTLIGFEAPRRARRLRACWCGGFSFFVFSGFDVAGAMDRHTRVEQRERAMIGM